MGGSVYLKARQEWDERYADLVLGKRNSVGGAVSVSGGGAAGLAWPIAPSRALSKDATTTHL
jgi:hypothetical protein